MAPLLPVSTDGQLAKRGHGKAEMTLSADILEAWAEGYMVGSLVILMLIVACNYRRHVFLHKLILLEMVFALLHGTFIFLDDPTYGWYLSATATLLFVSYQLHNVVSFLKIRPFLPRWGKWAYLITLVCVQPFWLVEAWDNFEYFNGDNNLNVYTRPWEALGRDPWWIFTTIFLLYKIKVQYEFTVTGLLGTSNRLVVMLGCMVLSIAFLLADVIVTAASLTQDTGINPYWRLTLVFKCAADTIFLDDFKSVLDSIVAKRFRKFRLSNGAPGRRNAYSGSDSLGTRPLSPTSRGPSEGLGNGAANGEKRNTSKGKRRSDQRWKSPMFRNKSLPIEEHVELVERGDSFRSGDDHSGEAILPKPMPSFSGNTITYER